MVREPRLRPPFIWKRCSMLDIKTVINNLPLAVLAVNRDRRVLVANKVAQAFTGRDESELIDKRGGEVMGCIHADDDPQGCGYGPGCDLCGPKNAVLRAFEGQANIPTFDTVVELAGIGPRDLRVSVTYLPPMLTVNRASMNRAPSSP
jgi:PAS domain-containing protein